MWTQLKQYVKWTPIRFKDVLKHFKPNLMLFIPQIATSVYTMLDVSMLGYLYHDVSHVSFYNQAQRFIKMFLFFITSIGAVMLCRGLPISMPRDRMRKCRGFCARRRGWRCIWRFLMIAGIISLIPLFYRLVPRRHLSDRHAADHLYDANHPVYISEQRFRYAVPASGRTYEGIHPLRHHWRADEFLFKRPVNAEVRRLARSPVRSSPS